MEVPEAIMTPGIRAGVMSWTQWTCAIWFSKRAVVMKSPHQSSSSVHTVEHCASLSRKYAKEAARNYEARTVSRLLYNDCLTVLCSSTRVRGFSLFRFLQDISGAQCFGLGARAQLFVQAIIPQSGSGWKGAVRFSVGK